MTTEPALAACLLLACLLAHGATNARGAALNEVASDRAAATEDGFSPRLHTEGRHLEDAAGRVVVLRGVNKPGFVDCPDGWWNLPGENLYAGIGRWRPEAVKASLDEINRWGANVVRLHTCVQWWVENPTTFTNEWRTVTYPKPFREMYEDVIRWAGERGLYVIVEFYNMKWQSGQETLPWPPHSDHADVIGSREEFVALWESVARQLGHYPHVMFEFYNEPHGGPELRGEWFAFTQEAIDRVRAVTDNIIVVQWGYGCWVNLDFPPPEHSAAALDWIEQYPLEGSNLVYSTHLYRNSGGAGSFATRGGVRCWEREDVLQALRLAGVQRVATELDVPLIVGEVGAYMRQEGEELERELAWFDNILQILNEWEVGYLAWAWHPEDHLAHGMLKDGSFFDGPNPAGRIFIDRAKGR
jgi:aryl-phospho-beta-D-glucosidase BglC (GH1 family)